MKFFPTILLTLAATVTALPAPEEFQEVGKRACGTNICSGYVAKGEADCTLSCMWGKCTKYTCDGDFEMVCGKNRDSCTRI